MKKFKIGDVVKLASGSDKMTIKEDATYGIDVVVCQWFDGTSLKEGEFPESSLIKDDGQSSWVAP